MLRSRGGATLGIMFPLPLARSGLVALLGMGLVGCGAAATPPPAKAIALPALHAPVQTPQHPCPPQATCWSAQALTQEPESVRREEVVFEDPRKSDFIDYRIPSLLSLPGGAEMVFAEKRIEAMCHEGDSGYIALVGKFRSSTALPWSRIPDFVICDRPGETCGNPTAVFDSRRNKVVVLMNENAGHIVQTKKSTEYCSSGSVCDRRTPGKPADWCGSVDPASPLSGGQCVKQGLPGVRCATTARGARRVSFVESNTADQWELGVTFGVPEVITSRVQEPDRAWDSVGPGHGIELGDGRLVFPAHSRNVFFDPSTGSWSYQSLLGAPGGGEGTLTRTNDGLLMRNDRPSGKQLERISQFRRYMSRQQPEGSWTPFSPVGQALMPTHGGRGLDGQQCAAYSADCDRFARPNQERGPTGVQGSVRRYSTGPEIDRLIFSGPASALDRFGLTVRLSYDEGETWPLGREVLPPKADEYTGYSSVDRQGDGVAVLFERRRSAGRSGPRKHTIHYRWLSLAGLLCGRAEPILIGGNAWMGNFTQRIRHADETLEYRGQGVFVGKKVDVLVRSSVKARSSDASAPVSVTFLDGGERLEGIVERAAPGKLQLPGGDLLLDAWDPGKPRCNVGY